jgi:hypothetical protein
LQQAALTAVVCVQETLEQEFNEWKARVVVDDVSFRVPWNGVQRGALSQADRAAPILHDPPKKIGLQCVFLAACVRPALIVYLFLSHC